MAAVAVVGSAVPSPASTLASANNKPANTASKVTSTTTKIQLRRGGWYSSGPPMAGMTAVPFPLRN